VGVKALCAGGQSGNRIENLGGKKGLEIASIRTEVRLKDGKYWLQAALLGFTGWCVCVSTSLSGAEKNAPAHALTGQVGAGTPRPVQ